MRQEKVVLNEVTDEVEVVGVKFPKNYKLTAHQMDESKFVEGKTIN